jgi:1,2-diacylglycerol 3-alpha-glucosyltransferase
MITSLNIAMVAACPFPTSQGSQVLIRELSEALVRRGHHLHIVTYHFGEAINCPGLTIHRIPEFFRYNKFRSGPAFRKPLLDILLSRKLDEVVRRHQIQIIHCHNYEAPVAAFPVRYLHKIPVVYHSHNTMSDEFYTYFKLKLPQILACGAANLMDRYIPRHADYVIAINRRVVEFLVKKGTPVSRIKFIPPGIDFGSDDRLVSEGLYPNPKYDRSNGPIIVYAGNLDGYQRMDLLLEALPSVFKTHAQARLVVLTGSDPEVLLRHASALNILDHLEIIHKPDFNLVKHLLLNSTVAVNPRISWSGYPIKLLNYMSAGLPVVAFQGAAPAIDDGFTGLLVQSPDVHAYSHAISSLLSDPGLAKRMGEMGKEMVKHNNSWDLIVPEIEQIYAHLLNLQIHSEKEKSLAA